MLQKISCLAPRAPPENELVEGSGERHFSLVFRPFFFILGEICPGLGLVSSPVAKCAYKLHIYRNNCIATESTYAWALSVGGVSPPLRASQLSATRKLTYCIKYNEKSYDFVTHFSC